MKDQHKKSMKRMSRTELLELLIEQMEENEQLKNENQQLKEQLENRTLICQTSGSLAEAALKLTRIFEEADRAVEIYHANLIGTSKQGSKEATNKTENTNDSNSSEQNLSDTKSGSNVQPDGNTDCKQKKKD